MADYISAYTGKEIDAGIAKANTALQSLPAHTHTADEIGAAAKESIELLEDRVETLEKSGGGSAAAAKTCVAFNWLDNSDFRDTVNQRGKTTYTGAVYGIDRWRGNPETTLTVNSNSITVSGKSIFQYIKGLAADAVLTFAYGNGSETHIGTVGYGESNACHYVDLPVGTWTWAAVYEGEYTAENLPAYVPKGYTVEFAMCRRYYRQFFKDNHGLIGMYDSPTKYCYVSVYMEDNPMRIVPTLIGSGHFYISGGTTGNTGTDVIMYKAATHKITMRVSPPSSISANVYLFNPQFDFGLSADL